MSDTILKAKTAREALARALAAVQGDATAPAELVAVAEPVSLAMGALFQIERSQGALLAQEGPKALDAVRGALALLQAQASSHSAVETAMEAVASSLGLVHALVRAATPLQPAPQPVPVATEPACSAPQPVPVTPEPAPVAPQPIAHTPVQAPHAYPTAEPAPMAIPPDAVRAEVALAAHSASNFYKGLSGNDVIEHGGIFVATYNVLKIGQRVALHILMPGGYELDALGIVRWTRETRDSLGDPNTHPGYGVALTNLSSEARSLVYRYVRNREPMFYDDL